MKKIIFTQCLLISCLMSVAQGNLCPEMKAFRKYCLDIREKVQNRDSIGLKDCTSNWDHTTGLLKYDKQEFIISQVGDGYIVCKDSTGLSNLDGHLQFMPSFVDSLSVHMKTLKSWTDFAANMRGWTDLAENTRGQYDCLYTHVCLKPKGHTTLWLEVIGDCELFIVSETEDEIKASISLENNTKPILKETSSAPFFKWNQNTQGCYLCLENTSEWDISVIICSN